MKLYVPNLGDRIRLDALWPFRLYQERRNKTLWRALGLPADGMDRWNWGSGNHPPQHVTLPSETILVVDRIYVRQGGENFASITFKVDRESPMRHIHKTRFWAKLEDCNQIEFTPLP